MKSIYGLFFALLLPLSANAQFGSGNFASHLNSTGRFYHSGSFNGTEVIFKKFGGTATREEAIASWLHSREGHREAILSGSITEIQCVGNVCVGRGSTQTNIQGTMTTTRKKVKLFRKRR